VENFRPEENLAVVKSHRVPGQWLPVWKLALLLKVRREKLLELIDDGEIGCAYDLRGKGASRATIRIPPHAVIAFLERTTISTATARRRVLHALRRTALRHASAVSVRFGVEVAAHARMLPMLVFTVANIVCPAVILAQVASHRFFRA
jgi:hypothetical protein